MGRLARRRKKNQSRDELQQQQQQQQPRRPFTVLGTSKREGAFGRVTQRLLNDLHDMAPLTALFSSHRLSWGR